MTRGQAGHEVSGTEKKQGTMEALCVIEQSPLTGNRAQVRARLLSLH